ncbi:MAG: adenylate/guanylate cyclase domain-containing protein [Bacteroidota bacterium]
MPEEKNKELIQRISQLVKENEKLKIQLKDLQNRNECLLLKVENLEKGVDKTAREKSLKFKMATVLFVGILGFDEISKQNYAKEMMDELDRLYIKFDEIAKKYKIEKIKTIGDSYMCAGGVPIKNITNPVDTVMAALEIRQHFIAMQEQFLQQNKKYWNFCIGMHTGPVTATTIGEKKVAYSLKGDTVNIASRLQSASEPGKINISVMTYELVREYFTCDFYGVLPVKYKDDHEMYYVRQLKKAYSENREGEIPNDIFRIKYKLRQFADLQEIYLDKLEKSLPDFLYYHNVKHTIDVITQVELIGWGEGVTDEELMFLKTAALFHDMGQIKGSKDHEDRSCDYAREYLPEYNYSEREINIICDLIMATKLPPKPNNLLQTIMCDADLDYLGRSDFMPVSDTLFKELHEQGIIDSLNEWNKMQVKFLSSHSYFTQTALNLREVNKQDQIDRISKLIIS